MLEQVLGAGRQIVRNFYSGTPLDAQQTWELFYPFISNFEMLSWGGTGNRNRYLNGESRRVLDFGYALKKDAAVRQCDQIVFISKGGLEPALIAAEQLNIPSVFPLAFSRYKFQDKKVCAPFWLYDQCPLQELRGKNILLVDDAAHAPKTTLKAVEQFITPHQPSSVTSQVVDDLGNTSWF